VTEIGATVLDHRGFKLGNSASKAERGESASATPGDAPLAGDELRIARERLGIDLSHAAEVLRIRVAHLQALEEGRLSALPSPAYALGFLRTYATALGLDPEEMVRRFRAEAIDVGQKTELAFPTPVPERGLPTGAIALLSVVLLAGVYAGWYRLSGEGRLPAETVPPIPERLAPLAEQAIPPLPVIRTAERPAPPPPDQLALVEPPLPAPPTSPSSAAAAPVNPLPAPPPTVTEPQPDQSRVLIRATSDAWLQVREKGGAILLNRVLKPGEVWAVPNRPGLVFTTGNAGGTELMLDGTALPSLGAMGAVRRDLPLDPDMLKDGRLNATPVMVPSRAQQ